MLIVFYLEGNGIGALATGGSGKFLLLMFAGIASAIPMGLFSSLMVNMPIFATKEKVKKTFKYV